MIDKSIQKQALHHFHSISELSKALGVSPPLHPLVHLINHDEISPASEVRYMIPNFYMISYKTNLKGKLRYGQGYYDFDEGGMIFVSPNQALSVVDEDDLCQGCSLFIHPDLLRAYPVSKTIKKFGFFAYNIHEALHLSDQEKQKILGLFYDIRQELQTPIDDISQGLIVSYIEVLLHYSDRYYKRQFITRDVVNHTVVEKFESYLADYFHSADPLHKGLPSVGYFADRLHLSSSYLSDMLRNVTGLNTQQHIHAKLIEKAKEKLTSTDLTVAEIAYDLGFEHPQSFIKLFKAKTSVTPLGYRNSLN
ncbi:Helix-turn-helix domain-containing protein [Catalinimonas alkaloidigena]|uniref:Helix-turn-helix domain-containing protein n=1 Tax=Catalinimonas alkaloidigena TaxID=1075417 RepID=A0A1G9TWV9_9BACT|nr:helix-turn-helix domain-containing protein [Catalinimonas alkaloidigena]SDM52187.1 Helix-turn-helix domain-containing protein [Catalinimonas alkaloidigena]